MAWVPSIDHTDLEKFRNYTSSDQLGGTPGKPTAAEGDEIARLMEIQFMSDTGVDYDDSDADHQVVMRWLSEIHVQGFHEDKAGNVMSRSTAHGSQSFRAAAHFSFTWAQYDAKVRKIRTGALPVDQGTHFSLTGGGDYVDQY